MRNDPAQARTEAPLRAPRAWLTAIRAGLLLGRAGLALLLGLMRYLAGNILGLFR